jgi:STE24 endopeptidase
MRKTRPALVIIGFAFCLSPSLAAKPAAAGAWSSEARQPATSAAVETQDSTQRATEGKITAYTLPPDLYKKAKDLSRIHFRFNLIGFFYGLFALWIVLRGKLAARYRDWAEQASSNRILQAAVFAPLLILTIAALQLPAEIYEHSVSRAYGISVEGWGAWAWDWAKALFLVMLIGSIMAWILYGVIRRSPRRWWFYFWLVSLPILLFLSFIEPFVIEPMFFQFAPLEQKDPELVAEIERVAHRAGLTIPPARMFWMKASDKTPTMNAYVSGIGASKRIVVWDTTVAKETTPEIVSGVGHEMGHYVLGHVWKGLLFSAVEMLVLLYLGFLSVGWVLGRCGPGWGIRGLFDWASLPALLLLLSVFSFVADPVSNGFSRHVEHQADVYGLEVTHGVIPDAGQAAAASFQVEGETSLADPDPNPVNVFLFYDHPPISERIRFCVTYDPWSKGLEPEFVR